LSLLDEKKKKKKQAASRPLILIRHASMPPRGREERTEPRQRANFFPSPGERKKKGRVWRGFFGDNVSGAVSALKGKKKEGESTHSLVYF